MDRSVIDHYLAGSETLAQAVSGLSPADLRWTPPAGAPADAGHWSIQQVVIHLADAELAIGMRMRMVIAQDNPTLGAWDETRFAARCFYEDQSAQDAIDLIRLIRRQTAVALRRLPDEAFQRAGQHTEKGRLTLAMIVTADIDHLERHVRFIQAKRRLMGK